MYVACNNGHCNSSLRRRYSVAVTETHVQCTWTCSMYHNASSCTVYTCTWRNPCWHPFTSFKHLNRYWVHTAGVPTTVHVHIKCLYIVHVHLITVICRNLLNSTAILHVEPQRNGCLYAREIMIFSLLWTHKRRSTGL